MREEWGTHQLATLFLREALRMGSIHVSKGHRWAAGEGFGAGRGGICCSEWLHGPQPQPAGWSCPAATPLPDNLIASQAVGGPVSQAVLSCTVSWHPPCLGQDNSPGL